MLIPLGRQLNYEQSRTLGELLARVFVKELPAIATITRAPAKREGKVYIDYVQNGHGCLLVAPFSARPLPGAPVSMALSWREINDRLHIDRHTINNAGRRLRVLACEPLIEILDLKPDISATLDRLASL